MHVQVPSQQLPYSPQATVKHASNLSQRAPEYAWLSQTHRPEEALHVPCAPQSIGEPHWRESGSPARLGQLLPPCVGGRVILLQLRRRRHHLRQWLHHHDHW